MNEFKNLSYQVTEPEYRAYPAYSYSLLSRFKQLGYANIDKLFDKISTPSLTFGKLVDCLVTEGEKVFRSTYTPMCIKVSDTIKEIVDDIYKNVLDASINIDILENLDTTAINEIAVRHSYDDNPRYDKSRADKVIKEGSEYFKLLMNNKNKTLVSYDDFTDALKCNEVLHNNPIINEVLTNKDTIFQAKFIHKIKFSDLKYMDSVKCMCDMIHIDDTNKTIQIYDLKTSSKPEFNFYKSFIEFNYNIQADLYNWIIKQIKSDYAVYTDYKVLPFKFIVINRKTLRPLIWEFNPEELLQRTNTEVVNKKITDWQDLIKDLDNTLNNNNIPVEFTDTNKIYSLIHKLSDESN